MLRKYYFFYILALVNITATEKHYVFRLTGLHCELLDDNFGSIPICHLKPIGRDMTEMSLRFNLRQGPVDNLTGSVRIMRRGFEHIPIMNIQIDVCAYFRNKRHNVLAEFIYKFLELAKYSNANHTCPYDHDFILDKYRVNTSRTLPCPLGFYKVQAVLSAYNVPRAEVVVHFQYLEEFVRINNKNFTKRP